jgi:hypothetical protein
MREQLDDLVRSVKAEVVDWYLHKNPIILGFFLISKIIRF